MKIKVVFFTLSIILLSCTKRDSNIDIFAQPERGFISTQKANNWQHGMLTGNGTTGAMVIGNPYDETISLSHESLFLPYEKTEEYMEMASHLQEIRDLCLASKLAEATQMIPKIREEQGYPDRRDPFIGAFNLRIQHESNAVRRYQRSVNFMTAEAKVAVEDGLNNFQRNTFVSRANDVVVVRIKGKEKLSAKLFFEALTPQNENEMKIVAEGIKTIQAEVKDHMLYFQTIFAKSNATNPNAGYEGVGKIITKGGSRTDTDKSINVSDADEILLLIKVRPIHKTDTLQSNFGAMVAAINSLNPDYTVLLEKHAKIHGDLMGRVSFSLNVPEEQRTLPTEELIAKTKKQNDARAMIEKAFDAGRYNIICSSGAYPPNLQGIWSAVWRTRWSGSFTINGNLECAIAFLLMGNTPELMESFFGFYDKQWDFFRENARLFNGTRGFHVPAQLTVNSRLTSFSTRFPHCFWHSGAAWACHFYYDYFQHTQDIRFLEERAYPIMKEAALFYEDFLIKPEGSNKLAFVPSYSPENSPTAETMPPVSINATMDISAAKQLLNDLIEASTILNKDIDMQDKWKKIISGMPDYEVGSDGSFREWLWPGLDDNNAHRHASHLYALYDHRPSEIVDDPELVKAVEHTIRERFAHQQATPIMAFGLVQIGLAAAHIENPQLTQDIINFLADGYWTTGMGSFHDRNNQFNTDISGGFPYLCASTLVYADPGYIRFFPARPEQWKSGSIKGLLLRGGVTVKELTWNKENAKAVIISKTDQTVKIENSKGVKKDYKLLPGKEIRIEVE